MNNKVYDKIANLIMKSEDKGGELVKLLEAVNDAMLDESTGVLFTQAVPEGGEGNPIIHISVFTNKMTDFPLDSEADYIKWVEDYLTCIQEEK